MAMRLHNFQKNYNRTDPDKSLQQSPIQKCKPIQIV